MSLDPPSEPTIAYAAPGMGMNPTWRLATYVMGGLGFTFCGGCFCLGVLILTQFVPRMSTGNGVPLPMSNGLTLFAIVLGVLAAGCFVTAIALIIAAFRFERVAR